MDNCVTLFVYSHACFRICFNVSSDVCTLSQCVENSCCWYTNTASPPPNDIVSVSHVCSFGEMLTERIYSPGPCESSYFSRLPRDSTLAIHFSTTSDHSAGHVSTSSSSYSAQYDARPVS